MPRYISSTRLAGVALAAVLIAGCTTATPTPAPRPSAPEGWVTITSVGQDVRLALPPWMVAIDSGGTIFANEVPPAGGDFLELMAEGPGGEQRPGPQDRMDDWLEARLAVAGPGVGRTSTLALPAGRAVRIERVVHGGTPLAWRFDAYAIRTNAGVGYLLIDGPVARWEGREADAALIPWLLELGPGS